MRDTFIRILREMAAENDRIVLITGDLGFGVLDAFAQELPNQYINAGVAEQNMSTIGAGMALASGLPRFRFADVYPRILGLGFSSWSRCDQPCGAGVMTPAPQEQIGCVYPPTSASAKTENSPKSPSPQTCENSSSSQMLSSNRIDHGQIPLDTQYGC